MSLIHDDDGLRHILATSHTIALVGASPKAARPSYQVMAYLQNAGYKVLPVNPGQEGQQILGETVYARLSDIEVPIDIVDIFRRAEFVPELVQEAIAIKADTLWTQLEIVNQAAAATASQAGLKVVMNLCTKIEHARLLG